MLIIPEIWEVKVQGQSGYTVWATDSVKKREERGRGQETGRGEETRAQPTAQGSSEGRR